MKTYLTPTEFADTFFKLYGARMNNTMLSSVSDDIVWRMFKQYEKDVKETLEGCLWGVEKYQGDDALDLIGYTFHKRFRQVDVIDSPHIDGIIWTCLQDAPIFWECLAKACHFLTSEDAPKLYKEESW